MKIIGGAKMNEMRAILALDPSLTAFGWAVVADGKPVQVGCIKTLPSNMKRGIRTGDDRCRRITEICDKLWYLKSYYEPELIVSEQPHGSQSAISAVMIGICLGMIQTFADLSALPLEWYLEGECKKSLLGKRSATKQEIIDAILTKYPSLELPEAKYQQEAICDAMAVYHHASRVSNIIKFLEVKK